MDLIYLATPYTHESKDVMEERYEMAIVATGRLLEKGYSVISPIVHSHPIAKKCRLPGIAEFWFNLLCKPLLTVCTRMFIVQMDGWETSKGIKMETALAESLYIPIVFVSWPDLLLTFQDEEEGEEI